MTSAPFEFDVNSLPHRLVPRARLLFGLPSVTGMDAVVLDADNDEFARVPGLRDGDFKTILGLTADGTNLLLAQHGLDRGKSLCLHNLATGHQQWLPTSDGEDWSAASSPDGRTIATLSAIYDPLNPGEYGEGLMAVSLIDLDGMGRERIWTTPGGASMESGVSWSPDGQLVAVTYLANFDDEDEEDEDWSTVVLETTGTLLGRYSHTAIMPSPNSTWLDEHHLLCVDNYEWQLHAIDARANTQRPLAQVGCLPLGILDHQAICPTEGGLDDLTRLIARPLDGTEPRPFLTLHPALPIHPFDIAPRTLT